MLGGGLSYHLMVVYLLILLHVMAMLTLFFRFPIDTNKTNHAIYYCVC